MWILVLERGFAIDADTRVEVVDAGFEPDEVDAGI